MTDEMGGDREYKERGASYGLIVAVIVAGAAVIFVLQNSETTNVMLLFFSATVPLSVVIIISMVPGGLHAWIAGLIRRRRIRLDE